MYNDRRNIPYGLLGVVLALLLLAIGAYIKMPSSNSVLSQRLAPQPTDPSAPTVEPFHLPALPEAVQQQIANMQATLSGGKVTIPLTPVAQNARLGVEVTSLQRKGDELRVVGSIRNLSGETLSIAPSAFAFRDSTGVSYSITGNSSVTLSPGQSTELDLSLPLPADRGLTLVLNLPPDPPLEQLLIVAATS